MNSTQTIKCAQEPIFLREQHLDAFMTNRDQLIAQSGKNGNPIYSPHDSSCTVSNSDLKLNRPSQWAAPVHTPGWVRTWGVMDDAQVVASLELLGAKIETRMHRALLMMGVVDGYKARGLGKSLLKSAIACAEASELKWIDLGVFANNEVAVSLYKSFGFQETGRVADSFRVYGVPITDIQMSLKL